MYLSHQVVLRAFRGLRKIFPQDTGKTRLERVSALRVYLAAAKVMHDTGLDRINLKADSDQRKTLTEAVGKIVALGSEGRYTQDFATKINQKEDFALGSNFLTTRVASSRNGRTEYPGRPKPILVLEGEELTFLEDAHTTLLSDFNVNSIRAELLIWLVRFENLPGTIEASHADLAKAILQRITEVFGKSIASLLKLDTEQLATYLSDCPTPLLENAQADLSAFWDQSSEKKTVEGTATQSTLDDTDPYLTAVRDALNRRGETNFLFYGAPGTGKTWYASEIARALTNGDLSRIKHLQFHPSVSYDDFVEGFVPKIDEKTKGVVYAIEKKHFVQFAELATKSNDNGDDNLYILIVDEISRGDPARVFGELLTYIETSYRSKEFSLIYSGDPFAVPENLLIFATANPYDRSVGELDDAFLRRFHMIEFSADSDLLKNKLIENSLTEADAQKVVHFFEVMHESLPHGFGHAQLFSVYNLDDLRLLWNSKLKFITERALQFERDKLEAIEAKYAELFGTVSNDAAVEPLAQPQNGE